MMLRALTATPKRAVTTAIRCYQLTRFLRAPSCRFYPSCSEYVAGCVERFGVAKGGILALLRLAKCHPFHPGGVDEVPSSSHSMR